MSDIDDVDLGRYLTKMANIEIRYLARLAARSECESPLAKIHLLADLCDNLPLSRYSRREWRGERDRASRRERAMEALCSCT